MTRQEVKTLLKDLPVYNGSIQINEYYIRKSENKYLLTNLIENKYDNNYIDSASYGYISLKKVMELFFKTDNNTVVIS